MAGHAGSGSRPARPRRHLAMPIRSAAGRHAGWRASGGELNSFMVEAPDIASAWIRAVSRLDEFPDRRAFHTVVRIAEPLRDNSDTHAGLDRVLDRLDLQPVETVADTIFPNGIAA